MPSINVDLQRKWRREHYDRNKQQYLERNAEKKARMREFILKRKDVPCMDCGVKYPPYVMDFDHRDPSDKLFTPARLHNTGSWKKMVEELDKCDVVCSNCHRERTYGKGCLC